MLGAPLVASTSSNICANCRRSASIAAARASRLATPSAALGAASSPLTSAPSLSVAACSGAPATRPLLGGLSSSRPKSTGGPAGAAASGGLLGEGRSGEPGARRDESDGDAPRLVDCLTLWLSNLMLDGADWQDAGERLVQALDAQTAPVILVTNEVGGGIVPENKLAREFRDAAGWLNQTVAEACESVWFSVAGCPVKVKPNDHSF